VSAQSVRYGRLTRTVKCPSPSDPARRLTLRKGTKVQYRPYFGSVVTIVALTGKHKGISTRCYSDAVTPARET
jgi:hypothetical protein